MADQTRSAASFSQRLRSGNATDSEIRQLAPAEISAVLLQLQKAKPLFHEKFGVAKIDFRKLNNEMKRMAWLVELNRAVTTRKSILMSSRRVPQAGEEQAEVTDEATKPKVSKKRRQVSCKICQKVCSGLDNLRDHQKVKHQMHGGSDEFTCIFCGQVFKKRFNRDMHHAKHAALRPYKCNHESCEDSFNQRSNLSRHVASRHKIQCRRCPAILGSPAALKAHYAERHPGEELPKINTNFRCVCGKIFPSISALDQHANDCPPIVANRAKLAEFKRTDRASCARPNNDGNNSPMTTPVATLPPLSTACSTSLTPLSTACSTSLTPFSTACSTSFTPLSTAVSSSFLQTTSSSMLSPRVEHAHSLQTPTSSPSCSPSFSFSSLPSPSSVFSPRAKHARSSGDGDVAASRRREIQSSLKTRQFISCVCEDIDPVFKLASLPASTQSAFAPPSLLPPGPFLFQNARSSSPSAQITRTRPPMSYYGRSVSHGDIMTPRTGTLPCSSQLPHIPGPLGTSQNAAALLPSSLSVPPLGFPILPDNSGQSESSTKGTTPPWPGHLSLPPLLPPPSMKTALPPPSTSVVQSMCATTARVSDYPPSSHDAISTCGVDRTALGRTPPVPSCNGTSQTSKTYTAEEYNMASAVYYALLSRSQELSPLSAALPDFSQLLQLAARCFPRAAHSQLTSHPSSNSSHPFTTMFSCPAKFRVGISNTSQASANMSAGQTRRGDCQSANATLHFDTRGHMQGAQPVVSSSPNITNLSLPSDSLLSFSQTHSRTPRVSSNPASSVANSISSHGDSLFATRGHGSSPGDSASSNSLDASISQNLTAMGSSQVDYSGILMPARQTSPYARPDAAKAFFPPATDSQNLKLSSVPTNSEATMSDTAAEYVCFAPSTAEEGSSLSIDFSRETAPSIGSYSLQSNPARHTA